MKLYINTSDSKKITIGLDQKRFEVDARREKTQMLLDFIDKILRKEGKKVDDIDEIEVNLGPGSYTGLRVGVSVANTFGWVLGVAVNGKIPGKGKPLEINYK